MQTPQSYLFFVANTENNANLLMTPEAKQQYSEPNAEYSLGYDRLQTILRTQYLKVIQGNESIIYIPTQQAMYSFMLLPEPVAIQWQQNGVWIEGGESQGHYQAFEGSIYMFPYNAATALQDIKNNGFTTVGDISFVIPPQEDDNIS